MLTRSSQSYETYIMTFFLKIATFNRVFIISLILIFFLDILSFYGIYSNKFYFFKIDNYIFPILTIIHILYMYRVRLKIKLRKRTDLQTQNLEYAMYFVFLIYLYKFFETIYTLFSFNTIDNSLIPKTFLPIGFLILILYLLLIISTLLLFELRKQLIGSINNLKR